MTATEVSAAEQLGEPVSVEHFDVLIVGAGISGVGAAYHLQEQCPGKSMVVLEALENFGGTWRMNHSYTVDLRVCNSAEGGSMMKRIDVRGGKLVKVTLP